MAGATTASGVNWPRIYLIVAGVLLAALAFLFWSVPRDGDEWLWTEQMIPGGWMAWSFPVALFFWCIGTILTVMTLLAIRFPETPRVGILGIETTRGDRLFITLLGSAFINLIWLASEAGPQPWAMAVCLAWAVLVFWKV
jgi:predicted small integral membrane protein